LFSNFFHGFGGFLLGDVQFYLPHYLPLAMPLPVTPIFEAAKLDIKHHQQHSTLSLLRNSRRPKSELRNAYREMMG
jgi:hypothetical protein